MAIYIACMNDFSLKAYWDAKAHAAMTEDTAGKTRKRTRKATAGDKTATRTSSTSGDASDSPLYHSLLDWRRQQARERHLPPHYILSLKALLAIAESAPTDIDELLTLPGIGPKTASEYGADLLALVRQHA